jgi:hypothetical protein
MTYMRTLNPLRFYRVLARRHRIDEASRRRERSITRRPLVDPTVYVDAAVARALAAVERQVGLLPAGGLKLLLTGPMSTVRTTGRG